MKAYELGTWFRLQFARRIASSVEQVFCALPPCRSTSRPGQVAHARSRLKVRGHSYGLRASERRLQLQKLPAAEERDRTSGKERLTRVRLSRSLRGYGPRWHTRPCCFGASCLPSRKLEVSMCKLAEALCSSVAAYLHLPSIPARVESWPHHVALPSCLRLDNRQPQTRSKASAVS